MYKYESIIIINPNKSQEKINKLINEFKNMMEGFANKKVTVEDLGEKKLAYEVQHNKTGHYVLFNFYAEPDNISKLERNYRINDDVMKFLTVRHEELEFNETEEDEEEEEY